MAVVSRIAKIVITNATGTSNRTFTATAAVQDTPAGSSVVVTITQTTTGALPPASPDVFQLLYNVTPTNAVRIFTLDTTVASQTDTFYFTSNGEAGFAARADTLELLLRVQKTTGGPTATYDVDSDGTPNTPPSTYTSTLDQGWIRASTTGVLTTSNVAFGGLKPAIYAYTSAGGDTIFARLTVGATSYIARQATVTIGSITPGFTSSSGLPPYDIPFTSFVDNRFPAASTAQVATATVSNAVLTGLPYIALTATPTDTLTVDPRITRTPLFQLDDNSFGTPPLSKDFPSHIRQSTQQGFLAERFTNARGEGVNGVTYSKSLTPVLPGTATSSTGNVTQVQGGQDGWAPNFLGWAAGLPGGSWTKAVTITAPSDITGATYLVPGAGVSDTYNLISKNPNLDVRMNVQHIAGLGGRHFNAGMTLIPTAYMIDASTGVRLLSSAITSANVSCVRPTTAANADGSGTGWEYLDAAGAWVTWAAADPVYLHAMAASTVDATTFEKVLATDASWGTRDIRFNITLLVNSVYYYATYIVVNVSALNQHDGYAFDGAGFVGFPSR